MSVSSLTILTPNRCKHRNYATTFAHCKYCTIEAAMNNNPSCGCADCKVLRIALLADEDFLVYDDENTYDWARWRTGTKGDGDTSAKVFLRDSPELITAIHRL
jgi:hypothetical protein